MKNFLNILFEQTIFFVKWYAPLNLSLTLILKVYTETVFSIISEIFDKILFEPPTLWVVFILSTWIIAGKKKNTGQIFFSKLHSCEILSKSVIPTSERFLIKDYKNVTRKVKEAASI